jgi:putative membrane protein insertion efficiency factor
MSNSITTSPKPLVAPAPANPSLGARSLVKVVAGYQWLFAGRASACRFYPSCSNYALEAIETHGAWRGTLLVIRRLGRCRPLGPHGVDLVPASRTRSSQR